MEFIDLKTTYLPGISLERWFESFQGDIRSDFGLEFLTELRHDVNLAEINPGLNLPAYVQERSLDDKMFQIVSDRFPDKSRECVQHVSQKRARRLRDHWQNGSVPRSLKILAELNLENRTQYKIDLLNPNVDSHKHLKSGISYANPFVVSLAYLSASILSGGCLFIEKGSSVRGYIHFPSDKDITDKLGCCWVNKTSKGIELHRGYARLLHFLDTDYFLDVNNFLFTNSPFKGLGINYLADLLEYYEAGSLSESDKQTSKKIFNSFINGVFDHRLRDYQKKGKYVQLPLFKDKSVAVDFADFFQKLLHLTNPFQTYRYGGVKKSRNAHGTYFESIFRLP